MIHCFKFVDRNEKFNPGLYERSKMLRASATNATATEMAIPLHLLHEFW